MNGYSSLAKESTGWDELGNIEGECTDPCNSTDSRLLAPERFLEVRKVCQSSSH